MFSADISVEEALRKEQYSTKINFSTKMKKVAFAQRFAVTSAKKKENYQRSWNLKIYIKVK